MLRGILELLRPANVVTALADVVAGASIAGLAHAQGLPWLLASTACLYAGGVVLNDVFDRDVDRSERPERPIPSGRVGVRTAAALGGSLLAAGVILAAQATGPAGMIAGTLALLVLLYDGWSTRHGWIAPVNMGLCRALNLLLGVAAHPPALGDAWPIAFIPLLYIGGVTALSRGEVHGGRAAAATAALAASGAALAGLVVVAVRSGEQRPAALALAAVAVWRVAPPFWKAGIRPEPAFIRAAVKRGVLSLILVDATIAAAWAGPIPAAAILGLGIAAGLLARLYAVT